MRIEELTAGLNITLIVNVNQEKLNFETKIAEVYPKKRFLLAEPIYHEGKVLSFRGKNLIVDLLVSVEENKLQLFKNITIDVVKKADGSIFYRITTIAESKPYNRRQNFRCYIGLSVCIQCGPNHSAHDAILRDISSSGFSVVCDGEVALDKKQIIHALLHDAFEDPTEKISFHLYGIITRTQELENGSFVYGCKLNSPVPGLDAYVMKKQRIRLKKLSGGDL